MLGVKTFENADPKLGYDLYQLFASGKVDDLDPYDVVAQAPTPQAEQYLMHHLKQLHSEHFT